jgi:hypothetical protein
LGQSHATQSNTRKRDEREADRTGCWSSKHKQRRHWFWPRRGSKA